MAVEPVPLGGLPEVGGVPGGSTLPRPAALVRLFTPLATPFSVLPSVPVVPDTVLPSPPVTLVTVLPSPPATLVIVLPSPPAAWFSPPVMPLPDVPPDGVPGTSVPTPPPMLCCPPPFRAPAAAVPLPEPPEPTDDVAPPAAAVPELPVAGAGPPSTS